MAYYHGQMNRIQKLLDEGHTKTLRDEIIMYVGQSPKRMKELMSFFFHEKWRYNQRSAWAVGEIGVFSPDMIQPYLAKMLEGLDNAKHIAIVRNTIKVYSEIAIPEDLEGELFDRCMKYVEDTKAAIAVRCYSVNVLETIASKYPELQEDLVAILSEHMPHGSAGFKYRCRRAIKRFSK